MNCAVGVKVAEAVGACLTEMVALELRETDGEEDGDVAARLQRGFGEGVVRPLGGGRDLGWYRGNNFHRQTRPSIPFQPAIAPFGNYKLCRR